MMSLFIPYLPWFFFGLAAVAVVVVALCDFLRRPRLVPFVSASLRLLAVFWLTMLLFDYFIGSGETSESLRPVVVLHDVSASMDAVSPDARQRRSSLAKIVSEWAASRPVHAVRYFASSVAASPDDARMNAGSSALGDAILSVGGEFPGAAVLLLTDAASNVGLNPVPAARAVHAVGTVLYPLTTRRAGDPPEPDLSLSKVKIRADLDSRRLIFSGLAVMTGADSSSEPMRLTLKITLDRDRSISIPVDFRPPVMPLSIPLNEIELPNAGWHEFAAELTSPLPESLPHNNAECGVFEIPPDDLVLLLYRRRNPEITHLRPILTDRYPSFAAYTVSAFAALTPETRSNLLLRARVLLAHDIGPADFPPDVSKSFLRLIQKKKLTLILLSPGTAKRFLVDPAYASFLPVERIGRTTNSRLPFQLQPENDKLQYTVLPVWNFTDLTPVSPLFVQFSAIPPKGEKRPAFLVSPQAAVPAFSGVWRWKLGRDRRSAAAYPAFWNALLDSSDNFQTGDFTLSVRKSADTAGADFFEFLLKDRSGGPRPDSVTLIPDDATASDTPPADSFRYADNGVWSLMRQVMKPGIHWFRAEIAVPGAAKRIRSTPCPVLVVPPMTEADFHPDPEPVLRRLAELTGGVVIGPDEARNLDQIVSLTGAHTFQFRVEFDPASNRVRLRYAILSLLALSLEWLFRKILELKNA